MQSNGFDHMKCFPELESVIPSLEIDLNLLMREKGHRELSFEDISQEACVSGLLPSVLVLEDRV